MTQLNKHPTDICVYHKNCLDGLAAAYVFRFHKPKALFVAGEYSSEEHESLITSIVEDSVKYYGVAETVTLYLVDFSYKAKFIDKLLRTFSTLDIVVIDHHKTAIAELGAYTNTNWNSTSLLARLHLHLDDRNSGAYLTAKYIQPNRVPHAIVRYVDDYDTWKKTCRYTDDIAAGLYDLGDEITTQEGLLKTFAAWDKVYTPETNVADLEDIYSCEALKTLALSGAVLNRSRHKRAKFLAKRDKIQMVELDGHEVPMVNAPHEVASFVGEELSLIHPFAVVYYVEGGKGCYSLRSNRKNPDWVDVEVVAKKYGGGGHPNAAAFKRPLIKHSFGSWELKIQDAKMRVKSMITDLSFTDFLNLAYLFALITVVTILVTVSV